jgi:small-conductance mechanosensitive channel
VWRYLTGGLAFAAAGGYMESTDVPGYLHPVQAVFFALLPLAVFDALGTVAANFLAERRARRRLPPRPRAAYSLLAAGWALIGGACALLAWAAGARTTGPGVGEDWIATGLIWATVICGCAALMTIGRAIPVGAVRPARLARGRAAQLEN